MVYPMYGLYSSTQGIYTSTLNYQTRFNPEVAERIRQKKRDDNVKTALTIGGTLLAIGTLLYCCKSGKTEAAQNAAKESKGFLGRLFSRSSKPAEKATAAAEGAASKATPKIPIKLSREYRAKIRELRDLKATLSPEDWNKKVQETIESLPKQERKFAKKCIKDYIKKPPQASAKSTLEVESIYKANNLAEIKPQNFPALMEDKSIPALPENTKGISGLFRQNDGADINFLLFENGNQKINIHLVKNSGGKYSGWIDKGTKTLHFYDDHLNILTRQTAPNDKLFDSMKKKLETTTERFDTLTTKSVDGKSQYITPEGHAANGFFIQEESGEQKLYKLKDGIVLARYDSSPDVTPYLITYGKGINTSGNLSSPQRQFIDLADDTFARKLDKIKF